MISDALRREIIANGGPEYAMRRFIKTGQHEYLEQLLDSDIELDINKQDGDGYTPLRLAVEANNFECLKLLHKHGADPLILSNRGVNIFRAAARKTCDMGMIDYLSNCFVTLNDPRLDEKDKLLPSLTIRQVDLIALVSCAMLDRSQENAASLFKIYSKISDTFPDKLFTHALNEVCVDVLKELNEGKLRVDDYSLAEQKHKVEPNVTEFLKTYSKRGACPFTYTQLADMESAMKIAKNFNSRKLNEIIDNAFLHNPLMHVKTASEADNLLKKGALIDATDANHDTALMRVLLMEEPPFELVQLFVDRNADITIANKNGGHPLIVASSDKDAYNLGALLRHKDARKMLDKPDNDGRTPLGVAISLVQVHGRKMPYAVDRISMLLRAGCDIEFKYKTENGVQVNNAIDAAMGIPDLDFRYRIISEIFELSDKAANIARSSFLIHLKPVSEDKKLASLFLAVSGAQDKFSRSADIEAGQSSSSSVLSDMAYRTKKFVSKHAGLNMTDDPTMQQKFIDAIKSSSLEKLSGYLRLGADPNLVVKYEGRNVPVLFIALSIGSVDVTSLLLNRGAYSRTINENGLTPLEYLATVDFPHVGELMKLFSGTHQTMTPKPVKPVEEETHVSAALAPPALSAIATPLPAVESDDPPAYDELPVSLESTSSTSSPVFFARFYAALAPRVEAANVADQFDAANAINDLDELANDLLVNMLPSAPEGVPDLPDEEQGMQHERIALN